MNLKSLFRSTDVTGQAIGVSYDPRIARYRQATSSATLAVPGTTEIHFQYGDLKDGGRRVGRPGANPEKIAIEPRSVELARGQHRRGCRSWASTRTATRST